MTLPPERSGRGDGRSRILTASKLIVGVALLAFLITRTDVGRLVERLESVDLYWLLLVLILPHLGIVLSTLKWQLLLQCVNVTASLGRLVRLYLVGTFFSNFLPTMVGGDVVRAYQLGRESGDHGAVAVATFLERYIGLGALVALLPLSLLQSEIVDAWSGVRWLVLVLVLGYVATLPVLARGATLLPNAVRKRFAGPVGTLSEHLGAFLGHPGSLILSGALSLVFYVVAAGASWASIHSVGVSVEFTYMLCVIPLVLLGGLLPVSLNGLGITETGYVLVLGAIGVSTEDALAMALILRGRVFLTAILGGVVFLLDRPELPDRSPERP